MQQTYGKRLLEEVAMSDQARGDGAGICELEADAEAAARAAEAATRALAFACRLSLRCALFSKPD